MGQPAARLGDMHLCPMVTPGTPPIPHVGGPILPTCAINVLTGKIPQARVTDKCLCVGPPDIIAKGSATVYVNKLMAARMGDMTAHGGTITIGLPNVLIGG
ncbi:MAG: PAAR domain-containing protein [Novosphingobium sp.]